MLRTQSKLNSNLVLMLRVGELCGEVAQAWVRVWLNFFYAQSVCYSFHKSSLNTFSLRSVCVQLYIFFPKIVDLMAQSPRKDLFLHFIFCSNGVQETREREKYTLSRLDDWKLFENDRVDCRCFYFFLYWTRLLKSVIPDCSQRVESFTLFHKYEYCSCTNFYSIEIIYGGMNNSAIDSH